MSCWWGNDWNKQQHDRRMASMWLGTMYNKDRKGFLQFASLPCNLIDKQNSAKRREEVKGKEQWSYWERTTCEKKEL